MTPRTSITSEQQIAGLNTQLMTAREEVNDKRARFEQALHVIDTNGDIGSIPELTASATLSELRRKQMELNLSAAGLQNKLGDRNTQVISIRAELAAVKEQIDAEVEHVLGNMKNDYDIAVRREQSLEANLKSLTASSNSETYIKLEQLRRAADADRKAYESYLSQYNDIAERREMQNASARIISWDTLPTSKPHKVLCVWRDSGFGRRFSARLPAGIFSTRRQDWHGDRAILRPAGRGGYSFGGATENPRRFLLSTLRQNGP